MKIQSIAVAAMAMSALFAGAGSAFAQTRAAAAASRPGPLVANGPAIPGICVAVHRLCVVGASAVGKFVATRLGQLKVLVEAEMNGEGQAIQTDEKALDASRSTLSADQYDQRAAALQIREREWQRKLQQRQSRACRRPRKRPSSGSSRKPSRSSSRVITERNCSVLLSGGAAMAADGVDGHHRRW